MEKSTKQILLTVVIWIKSHMELEKWFIQCDQTKSPVKI